VCRQRDELCVRVGYKELCVDREIKCGSENWLYGAMCRKRNVIWVRVGYKELCVCTQRDGRR
jgi:hypothetical protein